MNTHRRLFQSIIVFFAIFLFAQTIVAKNQVVLDFYYSSTCHSCDAYKPIIHDIEANYSGSVIVNWKDVNNQTIHQEWSSYGFTRYPSVVINASDNVTKIPIENLTFENLEIILNSSISNLQHEMIDTRTIAVVLAGAVGISAVALVIAYQQQKKKQK